MRLKTVNIHLTRKVRHRLCRMGSYQPSADRLAGTKVARGMRSAILKTRIHLRRDHMISRKGTAFIVAGGVLVGGFSLAAARQSRSDPTKPSSISQSPDTPVTRHSSQSPAEVQRHWTPDRIRQAQENMRRLKQ
jgi:hypothetical protein